MIIFNGLLTFDILQTFESLTNQERSTVVIN